ncbi:hypothetical protein [Mycolicibacterium sarraceniae]|uniref:hypothetical protein n=1 Tax=Mycolicibacterium sarraceniae TaxID=1534348 RepID=UPI001C65A887|nr:hypothetical protein [Mycolicibacterium sarraceniae]
MWPLLDIGAASGATALIKPLVDLMSPFTIFTPINPVKLIVDLASSPSPRSGNPAHPRTKGLQPQALSGTPPSCCSRAGSLPAPRAPVL